MRKIRQVLKLHHEHNYSQRTIASSLGISRNSVADYLTRATLAHLNWPLPADMDDASLEIHLFPTSRVISKLQDFEPDCAIVHQEMKAKGATLKVLYEEYLTVYPDGIGYSTYCERYRDYKKQLNPVMRQIYKAGEKVFVDYAGPTMKVFDPKTGNTRLAQIFVGVLGASNYLYAEAHWSQQLPDWIAAHIRMYEHFGGVPAAVVCDNLKSAVTKASRTDPDVNAIYQNLAEHYGMIVFPARAYKPEDKAKVENGVLIIERWVMFVLRKRLFTSLGELNEAIKLLLSDINKRPFKKLPGSRLNSFNTIDYPAMQALPAVPFVYAEFRKVRIGMDYHFTYQNCIYSVPYTLCRKEVELRITSTTIEVLHKGNRVASHIRDPNRVTSTNPEHMTEAHRQFGRWQSNDLLIWAEAIGPHLLEFVKKLVLTIRIQGQGYRTSLSIKKLAAEFGAVRLNAACERLMIISSNKISIKSMASLRSILRNRLDQQVITTSDVQEATFDHPNVRGAKYYH